MKYLISLYFDNRTNKQIHQYMETVADVTGNDYMIANRVPPHITVSSFEMQEMPDSTSVKLLEQRLAQALQDIAPGEVQWVGCGAFMNTVLYLTPVLNRYLQDIMQSVYSVVSECPNAGVSKYYRPFQWLPHTTISKKLTTEELVKGFDVVQRDFHILQGRITRIGMAIASPYEEIAEWELK